MTNLTNLGRLRQPNMERIEWTRGGMRRFVEVEPMATRGAMVGRDLLDPDGKIIEDLGRYVGSNVVAKDTRALNGVPADKIITPNGTLIVKQIQAEAIQAGSLQQNVALTGGRITATAGGLTLAMGVDMGAAADLLLWYGPTPANLDAALLKANGAFWIDEAGAAYFGGGLATAKVTEQLAGRGANLLPDEYSMYESVVLPPTFTFGNVATSRSAGEAFALGALRLTTLANTDWHYLFLGATTATLNVPITRGKKYLISAYVKGTASQFRFSLQDGTAYATDVSVPDLVVSAATVKRLFVVLDTTAFAAASTLAQVRCDVQGPINSYVDLEGIAIEEVIGTNYVPSGYTRGQAATLANSKTATFDQENQPASPPARPNDSWRQPSTGITRIFNGVGWSVQADNSVVSQDPTVVNRSFEQGLEGWAPNGGDGFSVVADAAAINGAKVLRKTGGSAAAELYNSAGALACNTNDRITGVASFKHDGGVVGTAHLVFHFYDTGGSYLGARWGGTMVTTALAAGQWQVVRDTVSCPTGTARCRIGFRVTGYNSGAWSFDQVGLAISTRSLADANEGVPSTGRNAIHNGNFSVMHTTLGVWVPNGEVPYQNWKKVAGAVTGGGNASLGILTANGYGGWSGYQPQVNINAPLSIPTGNSAYSDYLEYTGPLAFVPGQVVRLRARVWINHSYSLPAGLSATGGVQLVSYDASGGYLGIIEALATTQGYNGVVMNSGTIPAGAAKFRVLVQARIANTSGTTYTAASGIPVEMVVDDIEIITVANMDDDATHGTVYGKTSNEDLYDTGAPGYARRIGLNVKGSRKILGGARNSRASIVAGYNSVRSTTALSATSAGAVTVNAHNVEISGETVTYNAVSNAITGLSQSVTYTIFTLDPYLDGGTRTYYAQTSVLSAQQAGEGAVHIGNITIPTTGSSSGGGGGTGDPNDWCVAVEMALLDGRRADQVDAGDVIACWDERDPPGVEWLDVQSNAINTVECARIETDCGAAVVASRCTPMTLRDGRTVRIPDMLGELALVNRNGVLAWRPVVKVEPAGLRPVAKIKIHQRCYFAGETPHATIATHNPTQKP